MNNIFPWVDELSSAHLQSFYQRLAESAPEPILEGITQAYRDAQDQRRQLHHVLDTSQYVYEQLLRRPQQLIDLGAPQLPFKDYLLSLMADPPAQVEALNTSLRIVRNTAMVRIVWEEFTGQSSFQQTTAKLSELARVCIQASLEFHFEQLSGKHGTPRNSQGAKQPFIVLAMGKLGAQELNLSSDIDLIFTYPESGSTDNAEYGLSNQEFFARLGKKVIHSLDAVTAEGFVFRVDMRLRPYGQSGALVSNFDALEDYYQNQGREWERYAMVKVDVIAHNGTASDIAPLVELLNKFTYRKYIDFSVIDALRELKKMIVQEVKRRRLNDDIKLGSGGIREIEFIAQVFQLIRGGRDTALQDNRLLNILPQLDTLKCLPEGQAQVLEKAYIFLRNTEHAIQGYADQQTQQLPIDDKPKAALTRVLGFDSWDQFYDELNRHRAFVASIFASVIASPEDQDESLTTGQDWHSLWLNPDAPDTEDHLALLSASGYETPETSIKQLRDLNEWALISSMDATSRTRLDQFIPVLLCNLATRENASETLSRLLCLVKSVARRSAYLLLLIENPKAIQQLIALSESSPWIANQLAESPALLDELLDPHTLFNPPDKPALQSELQRDMLRIQEDDLEAQMEALRYFRSAHGLRVAASEITGALPLVQVSDYLTGIAEVILEYALQLSWTEMIKKHGYPDGVERDNPNFIIVGFGKLGGIELGHGSDLDLVFIHDAQPNGMSDGERSLDNQTYFMRLGQKIIHFLTANTASGDLYEVDMRLRPSGNSGMLVSSITSFEKYQQDAAWTWEHQALVRARPVAGDPQLTQRFSDVRQAILCRSRDLDTLAREVVDMRLKMRDHLGSDKSGQQTKAFHLKHDPGGIVDIEFMVQYAVLAWGHKHPPLANFTDNIRILESLEAAHLLDTQEVDQLIHAYKVFRAAGHRLTLQQQPNLVEPGHFSSEREAVIRIWRRLLTI